MNELTSADLQIIQEEVNNLETLQKVYNYVPGRSDRDDLLRQITDINESIPEVNSDELPQISAQLKRLTALLAQNDMHKEQKVDLDNPYFAHLKLREKSGVRDLYLGTQVYRSPGGEIQVIDWKSSPISILYFLYEDGDEYEEEIGGRLFEGEIEFKRILRFADGLLVRIQQGDWVYRRIDETAWEKSEARRHLLTGGAGTASRPENTAVVDPRLGIDHRGEIRKDKLLPEITALIDPEQFSLITSPETGIVAIQGTAGSGKTTVALHRVAWLHFQDQHRFAPEKMMVMVFNKALSNYISKVLPSLGVDNVAIDYFEQWVSRVRKRILSGKLPTAYCEMTPVSVIRFKKHPMLLKLIDKYIFEKDQAFKTELTRIAKERNFPDFPLAELNSMTLIARVFTLKEWVDGRQNFQNRDITGNAELISQLQHLLKDYVEEDATRVETVIRYWGDFFSDFKELKAAFMALSDDFSASSLDEVVGWIRDQYARLHSDETTSKADLLDIVEGESGVDSNRGVLDYEDDAILVYFYQKFFKTITQPAKQTPMLFSHIMVDEVQDFSPIELAVLLNVMKKPHSLTLAGDVDQKMIRHSGFRDWDLTFESLGIKGQKVSALKVGYRSTYEIMEFSQDVLGDLSNSKDFIATRHGPPVELFGFSNQGEQIQFLSKSLKDLQFAEPMASVALICISPQEAERCYQMLSKMEIPNVRLIADQDFPFAPGIDLTDVKQVKGLEFDYVVLLDVDVVNYPIDTYSRYLLHIAASRAAHQLWLMNHREPSLLLPDRLRGLALA